MQKRMKKNILHKTALVMSLCLMLCMIPASVGAQVRSGGTLSGMVRVYLSSIGSYQSVDLTVAGSYSIGGDKSRALVRGEKITVSNQGGTLKLTRGGVSESMGSSFKLRRHATGGENGVRIVQARNNANLYPGDVEFRARGGYVQIIIHVYIEDYMCGVLPYEMSNSFPVEALKAQAVAARTYTLKKMAAGASDYDVVDTTSDQTYRGTPSGNANCVSAVNATKGIVGLYDGSYMVSYYTASNGGQTESVKNAWNSTSYSYLTVKDDPYDLRNTASTTRTATIYKSGDMPSGLSELLRAGAASKLSALGYLAGSENLSIRSVSAVEALEPKYAAPSRLYTKVAFTMYLTATRTDGVREHVAQPVTVTLDYFSQMESLLSLSLNSTKNELISIEETDNAFKIVARRYGHGIGMSQRGAQQMAKEGFTYEDILDFYYPGTERVAYTFTRTMLSAIDGNSEDVVIDEGTIESEAADDAIVTLQNPLDTLNLRKEMSTLSSIIARIPHGTPLRVLEKQETWSRVQYGALSGYVANAYLTFTDESEQKTPQATTTPQPTPDALTQEYCFVSLNSGKLNLRARPNTTSAVLALLSNGTQLVRLSDAQNGWVQVEYSGIQGYVAERYLVIASVSTPKATPTPLPEATIEPPVEQPLEEESTDMAVVVLSSESQTLNLRLLPTTASSVLSRIRHGSQVQVLERYSGWSHVRYGSLLGYVMNDYLYFPGNFADPSAPKKEEATPVPEATSQPEATPEKEPEIEATPMPEVTPEIEEQELFATVTLSHTSSTLNVRRGPSTQTERIGEIRHGTPVRVLAYGDSWCGIDYGGTTGYVATSYLRFTDKIPVEDMPEIAPEATPSPKPQRVSAVEVQVRKYLNVREKPQSDARIIGRVRTGSVQTVTDTVGGFYEIIFEGDGYGYISADYAKPVEWSDAVTEVPQATSTPKPPAEQEKTPAPENDSARDDAIEPEGDNKTEQNDAQPEKDDEPQSESTPEPEMTPNPENTPEPYETASPSNVINTGKTAYTAELYEVCGDENTSLLEVKKGESVRVIAYEHSDWVRVEMQGIYGYMRMKDLSLRYETVRLASGAYSLYESASFDAQILATVQGGERVSILDADGEWAKVRVGGAKSGYILFDALDLSD